ncbi:hypothetical protein Y032_0058g2874 [Ancylostoma ceylanicum]|uniref:Uncharacterized protein n=1 Tax=Ancylostoma ceylanicum TaxID=53326 RepID=A0A016U5J9_9BILA|nr:hypothetical protein Y032_0058g2874 [Ancylostoma ceylanicum]
MRVCFVVLRFGSCVLVVLSIVTWKELVLILQKRARHEIDYSSWLVFVGTTSQHLYSTEALSAIVNCILQTHNGRKENLLRSKSMYSCVAKRQHKNLQVEGSTSKD